MSIVYWDVETYSQRNLKECGAHVYAADPSTGVFFMGYAIDDGEVQTWWPGDPVPAPFADPTGHLFVSDNWTFENLILTHVLIPQHGFTSIPIEQQDCAQRRALANAFPAELGLRCKALDLPYGKDPEARRAMLRLSRLHQYKNPAARERDLKLLLERCKTDVESTRACYTHPRMRPQLPEERHQLLLDAVINARGPCANIPFIKAGYAFAVETRAAINARLSELTAGTITSVDQVGRITDMVNACGHQMKALGKRSVAAVLAHQPDDLTRELLELRQHGAFASPRKFKGLLNRADPSDHRIRDALRIYGAGPGRWSSLGAQLHNLRRNDAEYPSSLVDALIAGNHAELARYGNPIEVVSQLSRAALCAAPGNELICVDYSAIESRIPAWIAGEEWKLAAFSKYDTSGDERLHSYCQTAAQMLRKDILAITKPERQMGKSAELACGFGGTNRAWRRIANDEDVRSDAEVQTIIRNWRSAHPKICEFWKRTMLAARLSIRSKRAIRVMPAPHPEIITDFDGTDFSITLPSGRAINYPNAHLTPNTKFEDSEPDISFFDNARGQWKETRAWFGTLVENVVQGTARDLLAAAIIRAEARWPGSVVFHCHDELILEAPIGAIPEKDVLALLLEPPAWAAGLPLGGKVHSGPLYLEAPATAEPFTETSPLIELAAELGERTQREGSKFSNDSDEAPVSPPAKEVTPWEGNSVFENDATPPHICIHCKIDPPDRTERAIGVDDAWIHPRCEDAYIRMRLAEEGIASEQTRKPPRPPQPPLLPPQDDEPSGGNGRGDDFDDIDDDDAGVSGYDYPYGEREIGRKVAKYFYRNMKGALHLKVVKRVTKSGKKSFPQYHLENGHWVKGAPTGPAIPYRLPELLAAPPNATVEICEGEKDANNLAALGLIATTNPGGAGKWTSDLNKWFAGFARANIYEDNDEAGRKHVTKAASELCGIVPDIRVVTFRELPEHGDVSDWLKTGKTREELLARAEQMLQFATLQSVCAADEEVEGLDWVWPGRFALGKIGLITGLPNEGKGLTFSDIMARITRGAPWPCGEGSAPLGNVLLLTAEDDIKDTVIPRLMAAGADLKRVTIIKMMREAGKERMFSLITDLHALRQKVVEVGDVKMVLIDPISAYLGIGKIDSFRATDVRAVLGPLKQFAEDLVTSILGILHFNKKTDVTNVMLRVSDSLAYTAASRHVYAIVDDPDNFRKLFIKGKNNLAPSEQKTLAFGFAEREVGTDKKTGKSIRAPYIVWHPDPVDITATDALRAASESKSPSEIDNAKHFLEALLSNGPVSSNDVKEAAKENGISQSTLRRTKKAFGIDVRKDGPPNEKGERTWQWHLPSKKEDERA